MKKKLEIMDLKRWNNLFLKNRFQIQEVDALIEIKESILKFQNMDEKVTRIEQEDIRSYLKNLLE